MHFFLSELSIHLRYEFLIDESFLNCLFRSAAIQSLDSLNDQIVQFIFTPKSAECDVSGGGNGDSLKPLERDSLKSNLALMRRLLVDAQGKFHRMMDDNKKLAAKIDNSLQVSDIARIYLNSALLCIHVLLQRFKKKNLRILNAYIHVLGAFKGKKEYW